jgi:hypothetical protein
VPPLTKTLTPATLPVFSFISAQLREAILTSLGSTYLPYVV